MAFDPDPLLGFADALRLPPPRAGEADDVREREAVRPLQVNISYIYT